LLLVDTNVLIHAADVDAQFHLPCHSWLQRQRIRPDAWFTTWSILYEFLRVTTHPRVMRRPWNAAQAWDFVTALLASPGISVLTATRRHAEVAREVIDEMPYLAGNVVHDAHTAILMREHGVRRICTRDMDFHQFSFLEIIDPVALAARRDARS
jgi:toxin-antitoxin system PIN domain toxin